MKPLRSGAILGVLLLTAPGLLVVRAPTERLVNGDCSAVVPPCWQELHYLVGGAWLGSVLGLVMARPASSSLAVTSADGRS